MNDLFEWKTNGKTCVMIQKFRDEGEDTYRRRNYYLVEAFKDDGGRVVIEDFGSRRKDKAIKQYSAWLLKYNIREER